MNQVKVKNYEAGNYEVIVVGAGHAGVEAALASARMGCETLLLTINMDMVAYMPCNPSIGGPAKGVVVREIDALGGQMGLNTDATYVQMRLLNTGKGPAVQALRAQSDKNLYSQTMKETIENTPHLDLKQGLVNDLIIEDGTCQGVITDTGGIYRSEAVVLTAGTSSRGKIMIGEVEYSAGPNNTLPSIQLSECLLEHGIELTRFQTGTPPRVKRESLDYDKMEIQPGDLEPNHFSFLTSDDQYSKDSLPCWLTHTNEATHEIIKNNLDRTPMFGGVIEGVGARYCPSIEDKIVRFSDKPRHQLFIEPEGWHTSEMYVQGYSTSMPEEVQINMLHSVPGLEEAKIMRPGYAIEYDVIVPHQLTLSLELKVIKHLFTAGQMNGTSGYEEAAGQGIIAGINAARKVQKKDPLILKRSEAYIGVMIDDLVTKGTTEPYRLLTSRAEYRLLLRHDNADLRLTDKGREIGLVDDERYKQFTDKKSRIEDEIKRLESVRFTPTTPGLEEYLDRIGSTRLKDGILAADLLKRPEVLYQELVKLIPSEDPLSRQEGLQVEIQIKYAGYIVKSLRQVEKIQGMEDQTLPQNIDYEAMDNITQEAKERLSLIQPSTLGQASRVSGVSPADIAVLSVYLKQGNTPRKS